MEHVKNEHWLENVMKKDEHWRLERALQSGELNESLLKYALFLSVKLGRLKCFELLNHHSVPIDIYDERGRNILHLCLSHKRTHMVEPVVEAINRRCTDKERLSLHNTPTSSRWMKETALGLALRLPSRRAVACTRLLLDNGSALYHETYTPDPPYLNRAVDDKNADLVTLLIEHGASVDAMSPEGISALTCAVQQDWQEGAHLLLKSGAQVDQTVPGRDTPLMTALSLGNLEMAELLLSYGADPLYQNWRGWSTLMSAASSGRYSVLQLMVDSVGEVCDVEQDEALHMVAQQPCIDSARLLLDRGWSVLQRDTQGRSVLQVAAQNLYGRDDEGPLLQLLLEEYTRTASQSRMVTDASVALVWACLHSSLKAVDLLLHYGARPDLSLDVKLDLDENNLALDWEGQTSALFITCQKLVKFTNGSHAFINLSGFQSSGVDLVILARLLQHGCRLDTKCSTHQGPMTALELVVCGREPWAVVAQMLWEAGAALSTMAFMLSEFPLTVKGRAVYTFIKQVFSQPRSLYSLSACSIRSCLVKNSLPLTEATSQLHLPLQVKEYLQLKFLEDLFKNEESTIVRGASNQSLLGQYLDQLDDEAWSSSGSSVWDFNASGSGSSADSDYDWEYSEEEGDAGD